MKSGDTFLMPAPGLSNKKPHLWIVTTDPDDNHNVVIVSLTTLRHGADQTVVLRKGEHPWLKWDSSVFYGDARLVDVRLLNARVKSGTIRIDAPCPAATLKNVQDGILASDFTPQKVQNFYKALKQKP